MQLHAGPVAGGAPVGDSGRLDDQAAPRPAAPGELEAEPRLAHPHVAHHRHDLPGAPQHRVDRFVEARQLHLAPHERRARAGRGRVEARADRHRAADLVHVDRRLQAAHRHRPEGPRGHAAPHQREGVLGGQDRGGLGHLLHARGQVHGLAHRGVGEREIAADGARHYFAGVEADPDLQRQAERALQLVAEREHLRLHAQGRVAGPHRVVLVGERRTEERHDALPHHLVDRAFVAMHRFHHQLAHLVDDRADLLGIAVADRLDHPVDAREEHGDLLALALESLPGVEDALGQVRRGVDAGRGEAGGPARVEPAPARGTESRAVGGGVRAAGARLAHRDAAQSTIALGDGLRASVVVKDVEYSAAGER